MKCSPRNVLINLPWTIRLLLVLACTFVLSHQAVLGQTSVCTPGSVANGNQDPWSEECYLNSECLISGNPCTANDVDLLAVYIADAYGDPIKPLNCIENETAQVYLWGTLANGTGTDRYAVRIYTELFVDEIFSQAYNQCVQNVIPANSVGNYPLFFYTIDCDYTYELRNTWVTWSATAGQCTDPQGANYTSTCGDYPASKCGKEWAPIKIVVPNMTWSCGTYDSDSITVSFVGSASGGVPPYTYEWDFGDETTGSGASITHTYNTSLSGEFTVTLKVTDSKGSYGMVADALHLPWITCPADPISTCDNDQVGFALTDTPGLQATPEGGTGTYYYLSGGYPGTISGNPITDFVPAAAGLGEHKLSYIYTVGGCSDLCYFSIFVYEQPTVTCPDPPAVCPSTTPLPLTGEYGATGSPSGGTAEYSGAEVRPDGSGGYTLIITENGNHEITFTYTFNGCKESCVYTINVTALAITCPPDVTIQGCDINALSTATYWPYSLEETEIEYSAFIGPVGRLIATKRNTNISIGTRRPPVNARLWLRGLLP